MIGVIGEGKLMDGFDEGYGLELMIEPGEYFSEYFDRFDVSILELYGFDSLSELLLFITVMEPILNP